MTTTLNLTEKQCDELLYSMSNQTSFYMVNTKLSSIYGFSFAGFVSILMNKSKFYHEQNEMTKDGFYFTDDNLHVIGFTYSEIAKFKKKIQEEEFFTVKKIGTPSKTYYKINSKKIIAIISTEISILDLGLKRIIESKNDDNNDIDKITNFEDFSYRDLRMLCKKKNISYSGNDKKLDLVLKLKRESGLLENDENLQCTGISSTSVQKNETLEKMKVLNQCTENSYTSVQENRPLEEMGSSDIQCTEKLSTSVQDSCHNINIINKYNNMTCHDEKNKKEKDIEIEKIFHGLKINYTDTNEIYSLKILEALDGNKEFLKIYLEKVYKEISNLSVVKNIAALFSVKIKEIDYSLINKIKNENKDKTEKIKEEQEKIEEEKRIRENIEKQDKILRKFLALDEEIQKDITKQAEKYYDGSENTLEMFKKVSYKSYLKAIYRELLRVIKENYPKLIEGEGV